MPRPTDITAEIRPREIGASAGSHREESKAVHYPDNVRVTAHITTVAYTCTLFKVLLLLLLPILQGFTFNYDVLAECERRHPSDLLTRLICNSKVEDEFRESRSFACVSGQRKELISRHRAPLHTLLAEFGKEDYLVINAELTGLGYEPQLTTSKDGIKIIFFEKAIACDTKAKLLFNVVFDKSGLVDHLRAWIRYPKDLQHLVMPVGEIAEFWWQRQVNVLYIEFATHAREMREAKAREEAVRKSKAFNEELRIVAWLLSTLLLLFSIPWLYSRYRSWRKVTAINQSEPRDGVNPEGQTNSINSDSVEDIFKARSCTEAELKLMAEFKSTHAFVHFDIPPEFFRDFLDESMWYKEKTGVYPGIAEQRQILLELRDSRYPSQA